MGRKGRAATKGHTQWAAQYGNATYAPAGAHYVPAWRPQVPRPPAARGPTRLSEEPDLAWATKRSQASVDEEKAMRSAMMVSAEDEAMRRIMAETAGEGAQLQAALAVSAATAHAPPAPAAAGPSAATLHRHEAVRGGGARLGGADGRNNGVGTRGLATAFPNEHLTMIFDAMAHNALDGPVLSRHARLSKDTDSAHRMPVHLVGGLTWGAGGHRTWCYFYDLLVSGGANNTCEVLMRMLEWLGAADKLPKDPKNRVLHLQADNCADNKNWVVLALCAVLVTTPLLPKVQLPFLHSGHPHQEIDHDLTPLPSSLRHIAADPPRTPTHSGRLSTPPASAPCSSLLRKALRQNEGTFHGGITRSLPRLMHAVGDAGSPMCRL